MDVTRGASAVLALAGGARVSLTYNADIFTADGNFIPTSQFSDNSTVHLLSLDWPNIARDSCVTTHWLPSISAPKSADRKHEFTQATVKEVGLSNWEVLKMVANKCKTLYGAYLLEVTLWGFTLGHDDRRSAEEAVSSRKDIEGFLAYMLADTEYLFSDVVIMWSDPKLISANMPVQVSSEDIRPQLALAALPSQNSLEADGGDSLPTKSSGEHEESDDNLFLDDKELLTQMFREIRTVNHRVKELDLKVERYHNDVCRVLDGSDRARLKLTDGVSGVESNGSGHLALSHSQVSGGDVDTTEYSVHPPQDSGVSSNRSGSVRARGSSTVSGSSNRHLQNDSQFGGGSEALQHTRTSRSGVHTGHPQPSVQEQGKQTRSAVGHGNNSQAEQAFGDHRATGRQAGQAFQAQTGLQTNAGTARGQHHVLENQASRNSHSGNTSHSESKDFSDYNGHAVSSSHPRNTNPPDSSHQVIVRFPSEIGDHQNVSRLSDGSDSLAQDGLTANTPKSQTAHHATSSRQTTQRNTPSSDTSSSPTNVHSTPQQNTSTAAANSSHTNVHSGTQRNTSTAAANSQRTNVTLSTHTAELREQGWSGNRSAHQRSDTSGQSAQSLRHNQATVNPTDRVTAADRTAQQTRINIASSSSGSAGTSGRGQEAKRPTENGVPPTVITSSPPEKTDDDSISSSRLNGDSAPLSNGDHNFHSERRQGQSEIKRSHRNSADQFTNKSLDSSDSSNRNNNNNNTATSTSPPTPTTSTQQSFTNRQSYARQPSEYVSEQSLRSSASTRGTAGRESSYNGAARGTTRDSFRQTFSHAPAPSLSRSSDPDRTKSVSQERMTIVCESADEARIVKASVDRAYFDDPIRAPKAKSFDTILCLDISESMVSSGAFDAMKIAALQFVDGVEDVVTQSGVEENIGLVTFGGRANVVQNLTNDLSLIRDRIEEMKPGGKSPFVEALLVSMAAFVGKGGIVSVSGEWEVKPRIIFISDGQPTESTELVGCDNANNITNVRLSLSRMLISFQNSDSFSKVHPVIFIPVGDRADKKYMQAMAKICGGVYTEPDKITELCRYFRVQETIGKVLVCLRRESETADEGKVEATVTALNPDMTDTEKAEVIQAVMTELKNPARARMRRPRPSEMEYVFEDAAKLAKGERLPLGTRVIRGPDWEWGDQDGCSPGTVISHHEQHSIHWVKWDKGEYNCYPYSKRRGYHLLPTDDHPYLMHPGDYLEIGMTVRKGPNWNPSQAQPGQGEGVGVVVRKSREKVVVRWPNGTFQTCQWYISGPKEVDYCNPVATVPPQHSNNSSQAGQQRRPAPTNHNASGGQGAWHWRDTDGTWKPYSPDANKIIETTYQKNLKLNKQHSCIIERDGRTRRIMFTKNMEKVIDETQTECEIKRF